LAASNLRVKLSKVPDAHWSALGDQGTQETSGASPSVNGRARNEDGTVVAATNRWSAPLPQPNDLSRSLVTLEQDATLIAVIEMGQSA